MDLLIKQLIIAALIETILIYSMYSKYKATPGRELA